MNPNTAEGGVITTRAPWVVSIGYNDELGNYQHECTGTVISNIAILTAAHCTKSRYNSIMIMINDILKS